MGVLDRKLLRDLWRLKTQALAIALVMAAGAATLILGVGVHRSLDETRAALYERQRFADIFANVRRAPERLSEAIAEIPGVAADETRIVDAAILAIEGMAEPASAMLVSVPDSGEAVLNALHMRLGRMPDPARPDEVVINEADYTLLETDTYHHSPVPVVYATAQPIRRRIEDPDCANDFGILEELRATDGSLSDATEQLKRLLVG